MAEDAERSWISSSQLLLGLEGIDVRRDIAADTWNITRLSQEAIWTMKRRYTDQEVSLILRRALEPTATEKSVDVSGSGLSLEQIKEIAAEVGVDPQRIDLAAASLTEPTPARPNPYVGIPTTVQFQTTLAGVTMADISQHDILTLVRTSLGRQGIVDSEAGSLEWRARDAFGGRYVSITPSPDGVRLRVLGNYRDALFSFAAVLGVTTFGGASVVLGGAEVAPALSFLVGAVAALIPPRFAYRWWRKREDATMADLHGKLVALLQSSTGQATSSGPESTS